MNKVTIVGSLNVDTTLRIKRMPLPGETLAAEGKSSAAGGKGANQAVSAARSGAQTAFIGEVGKDNSGQMMLDEMKANGIDVAGIRENDQVGTGTASILLDENGQNSILGIQNWNLRWQKDLRMIIRWRTLPVIPSMWIRSSIRMRW